MCNASLHLPVYQRNAIITPLMKKSNLDATDVKNYRPVSNLLTFVSKKSRAIHIGMAYRFPTYKSTQVKPLCKKHGLDVTNAANYRPNLKPQHNFENSDETISG